MRRSRVRAVILAVEMALAGWVIGAAVPWCTGGGRLGHHVRDSAGGAGQGQMKACHAYLRVGHTIVDVHQAVVGVHGGGKDHVGDDPMLLVRVPRFQDRLGSPVDDAPGVSPVQQQDAGAVADPRADLGALHAVVDRQPASVGGQEWRSSTDV